MPAKKSPKKVAKKSAAKPASKAKKTLKPAKKSAKPAKKPVKSAVKPSDKPSAGKLSEAERISEIVRLLRRGYKNIKIALHYNTPLDLLIAVMLSAQCTDKQVNIVTETLFKKYRSARDYAEAYLPELEEEVKSTGFYHQKAKNIQETCRILVEKHNGDVPHTMPELIELPGVARKTANIVLSSAFNINDGIAVDTHVGRLSQRMGFSKNSDPDKIEQDLMKLFPRANWNLITYLLIEHGRAICKAPTPSCSECALSELCPKVGVLKSK
ncbi:G/T mismatches repair enzyme [uncultured archaeon]|nr:G/T mismatches repair enzyme [uncultured archaeon]